MNNDKTLFDNDDSAAAITPTPLSKPVLEAIFQNADVSGLALKSLINATLEDSDDMPIGEVISVIPESVHSETSRRGYRLDVKATSNGNEIALVEVQLSQFSSMVERSLLYAEQALASGAERGMKLSKVISAMPRVISVNVLGVDARATGGFHQVVELLYREPPYEQATDRFMIHNLELSKFRAMGIERLCNPLYCWLAALCRSQYEKKCMTEVVAMDAQLQEFYDHDPGFAQFVDRYGIVAATPEVRKAYRHWEYEMILERLEEERKAAKDAAIAAKHAAELADREAALADKDAALAVKDAALAAVRADKDAALADKDAALAAERAENERLRALLENREA